MRVFVKTAAAAWTQAAPTALFGFEGSHFSLQITIISLSKSRSVTERARSFDSVMRYPLFGASFWSRLDVERPFRANHTCSGEPYNVFLFSFFLYHHLLNAINLKFTHSHHSYLFKNGGQTPNKHF